MADLLQRLREALDQTELAANQCVEKNWRVDGANSCQVYVRREDYSTRTIAWCGNGHDDDFSNVIHIALNDPARVLRQVAAHRKILEIAEIALADDGEDATAQDLVLALAEGYDIAEETAS